MTPGQILAMYRSMCRQTVKIRRYSSLVAGHVPADFSAFGNATLYGAADLVGSVKQGDRRVIIIADDLAAAGLQLPVVPTDRVLVNGKELAIQSIGERNALDGTIIAYEIQARG